VQGEYPADEEGG